MDTNGRIHELSNPLDRPEGMIPVNGYPNPQCLQCLGRGFQRVLLKGISTLIQPCACLGTTDQVKAKAEYQKMSHRWPVDEVKRGIADAERMLRVKKAEVLEIESVLARITAR